MTGERALVLGGGGVTGIAWELGILSGLAEAGVDLTQADLVVGTSAGSVVGAQVTSGLDVQELYERQLRPPTSELAASFGIGSMIRYGLATIGARDPRAVRARIGRMALHAKTASESERLAVIESRLPLTDWPKRRLVIAAVDALSGEFTGFDASSGVPLVRAVAASCAVPGVWPPVSMDGRRWIDGGVRSAANADLAEGCRRVVVLAPIVRGFGPVPSVDKQAAALRSAGSEVVVVSPNRAALEAIGRNMLDPGRRAGSARAGRRQAAAIADTVAAIW
ncbi:patatin-like phospholipase family protein [Fodinicola acaciae]|uniref:patatin-like phospholipase family protein n=1 Tax=Fodinicola acaciae TaxID=2681555 RepID=UPI0013CFDB2E|nr:patatin-like phospholipase family protein [Fodinicola acaciae]